jgi:Uma2 family endonuclease
MTAITTTPSEQESALGSHVWRGRVPYRMPVEKYEAMIAAGLLTEHDRIELIEGVLVKKMTKGRKHSTSSVKCRQAIERVLPEGWHVRVETPVRIQARDSMPDPDVSLARDSMPDPDVSLARGVADDYDARDPGPEDLALVVEVSDASLVADRALAATYIGGGVVLYWIVNVADRQLEVFTRGSEVPAILGENAAAELILDGTVGARIAVADLLPRGRV